VSHDPDARAIDAAPLPPGLDQVALVPWPEEADRRQDLAAAGAPRILLLDPATPPPQCWDDREDWIRLPADPADLAARAASLLSRRATTVGAPFPSVPVLDADGLLRAGAQWVALPPVEARLAARLLHRLDEVVSREALLAAGWPHGAPAGRVLDGRIKLLRRRLAPFGLEILTVRGVGYLLSPRR
jgi:hypothetical protein